MWILQSFQTNLQKINLMYCETKSWRKKEWYGQMAYKYIHFEILLVKFKTK